MALDDILGHEQIRAGLKAAFDADMVHHAMLFCGPPGVGKAATARAFAALTACPRRARDGDACGACKSCERILGHATGEEMRHPDVLWITTETSAIIKIAQIRKILGIVPYPPIEALVRTVVIEPADAMNVEAANALLKTLEEPPSTTRFILVTQRPDALLTTIRSRCQPLHFGRLSDDDVTDGLQRAGLDEARAERVASLADGSLGAALELIDDPVLAQGDDILERCVAVRPGDATAALALAGELSDPKDQVPRVLELLHRFYRDAMLVSTGAADRVRLTHPHLADTLISTIVKRLGTEAILHRVALISDTQAAMTSRNIPGRLSLERVLVALLAHPGREGAKPVMDTLAR